MTATPESIDLFLGHPIPYWLELERRLREGSPNSERLIEEIAALRGRLNFYETRIKEMAHIAEKSI